MVNSFRSDSLSCLYLAKVLREAIEIDTRFRQLLDLTDERLISKPVVRADASSVKAFSDSSARVYRNPLRFSNEVVTSSNALVI